MGPEPSPSLFERSVAVSALAPRCYRANVEPAWNGPAAPNGGVLAATMLRAAQAELGPSAPAPRTIAAHYLDAPAAGEVEMTVEVLRRGKRVAVSDVRMRQGQRLVGQATVLCSAAREPATGLTRSPPAVPPPEQVPTFRAPPSAPPVARALEMRPVFGPPQFTGAAEALTGGWMALPGDGAVLDAARLCALCDLWWPAMFARLREPAGVPTLALTVYLRRTEPTPPGPVLGRFETLHLGEGHLEESGELWSVTGELLAESRQLALLA